MQSNFSTLNELLVSRASELAEACAFFNKEGSVSYADLNNKTTQVAKWLLAKDMGKKCIILYMPRGISFIVNMLGTLRAGCVCIPVDVDQGVLRLKEIINRLNLAGDSCYVITIDSLLPLLQEQNIKNSIPESFLHEPLNDCKLPEVDENQNAFIFFTSGSSGQPKGVVLSHKAILDGQKWLNLNYPVNKGESLLFRTPINVTNVIRECFWPLIAGARAFVLAPDEHREPLAHIHAIKENKIVNLVVTPALLDQIMEFKEFKSLDSLKHTFVTSDVVHSKTVKKYLETGLKASLHNLYGLTEAFYGAVCDLDSSYGDGQKIPIGHSAQLTIVIYKDDFVEAKPGEIGELYLSGSGLAAGYYADSSLTEKKFINHPYQPGLRLFKTGDLASMDENKAVLLVGRQDFQIKVHGHRIETEEIEGVLKGYSGIQHCGLTVIELEGFTKLVMFYQASTKINTMTLRRFMEAKLPSYAIPHLFIFVDSLPLTSSGKVDRQKLKQIEIEQEIREEQFISPAETEIEKVLLAIWIKYLKKTAIGIDSDFFELGGDSIIAMIIIAKFKEAGFSLSITDFFSARTIRHLAKMSRHEMAKPEEQRSHPVSNKQVEQVVFNRYGRDQIEKIFPVSPVQAGMLFHTLLEPESGVYYEQLTHKIRGEFHVETFHQAWRDVINSCQLLRSAFLWENTEIPQHVVFKNVELAQEFIDLSAQAENLKQEFVEKTLVRYRRESFNFAQPSLLRLLTFKLADNYFLFTVNYHHILLDAWSFYLLVKTVLTTYQKRLSGQSLDEAQVPFEDKFDRYIEIIRSYDYAKPRVFWQSYLSSYKDSHFITHWHPDSKGHGDLKFVVNAETTALLRYQALKLGITINVIFLTAWFAFLSTLSKRREVVAGMIITYRPPILEHIEKLVGVCVNAIPVKTIFDLNESKVDAMHRIFNEQSKIREYDYLPTAEIQKCTSFPPGHPLFDTLLIFENFQPDTQLAIKTESISFECIRYDGWTNYPLSLTINNVNNMSGLIGEEMVSDFVKNDEILIRYKGDKQFFTNEELVKISHAFEKSLILFANEENLTLQKIGELLQETEAFENVRSGDRNIPQRRKAEQIPDDDIVLSVERLPKLRAIFAEVLGRSVNDQDNFFELGGDSFKAMQLVGKINFYYQTELPLEQFFHAPSIKGVCAILSRLVEYQ